VVVQVTGKVRDRLLLRKDLPKAEARERALALPRVAELVPGAPRKLVYVPGRLVNVVG
jgi:leucyl-tRNA synthetase